MSAYELSEYGKKKMQVEMLKIYRTFLGNPGKFEEIKTAIS